tara:strand:+ start:8320 stop:8520 length:201 start_codon:yes stop_codon:yes gene_type:complete
MSDKIGIYLTYDQLEHIHTALGIYSGRLLKESKKEKWASDDWKEVIELKRMILKPYKYDRLVKPTT